MAQKPLSYLGSQCVFQYLDADRRFALAALCPSLRALHKQMPFVIDRLELEENAFVLNGLEYNFRILFEPNGLTDRQKRINTGGGVAYDVDQFGRRDRNHYLEQGDIQVGEVRTLFPWQEERYHLTEVNWDRRARGLQNCRFTSMTEQGTVDLEEVIPRPVYQHQACCVVRRSGKSNQVRFSMGTTIRDMLRLQLGNLLNIKHPITVRSLNINIENGTLRFPSNLDLRTRKLTATPTVLQSIISILPSNHSIPNVATQKITFDQLTIQGARISDLDFSNPPGPIHISAATLIKLSTRPIHLTHELRQQNDLLVLYQNWIETSRAIRTKLTMKTSDPMMILRFFEEQTGIPSRNTRLYLRSTWCITTPVGEDKELNIYKKRDKLVMEMMGKGAAVEING